MNPFVLDTSALITFHCDEAGSDQVEHVLRLAQNKKALALVSFVTLTEVFYIFWQKQGKEAAYKIQIQLKMLPIEFVYPDESLLLKAGEIKANHAVSLADAFVAALAQERDAILIHKDPEFESLSSLIQLKNLPYKKA